MVCPARIELTLLVPETSVLSVELRAQIRTYYTILWYNNQHWRVSHRKEQAPCCTLLRSYH